MLRGVNGSGGGAPVGGSGTTNTIPRWTGPSTLGDSGLIDDSTSIYTSTRRVGVDTSTTLANVKFQVGSASSLGNYQGAASGFILPAGNGNWMEFAENSATGTMFRISKDTNTGVLFNANGKDIGFVASSYQTFVSSSQLVIKTSGNVGIGTASPAARVHSVAADGTYQLALAGTTKGIRFQTTAAQSQIDGVDSTLVGSYQPLAINGSTLGFLIGGVTKAGINGSSQLYVSTNGTAASPVICESTGVSGMYFPSATTVAIAANGAIAATFSKVAGAGVALGGTTGLVFDASGSQQGIKLRATPDSTDTQTLDCYSEPTWTPTDASGAGLAITVNRATYTKVGRTVTATLDIQYPITANASAAKINLPESTSTQNIGAVVVGYCSVTAVGLTGIIENGKLDFYYGSPSAAVPNSALSNARIVLSVSFNV